MLFTDYEPADFLFLSIQVEASLDIDPDNEDLTKLRNDLQVSHVTMYLVRDNSLVRPVLIYIVIVLHI